MRIAVWLGIIALAGIDAETMVSGVITSTILELIIYPAIYMIWRGRSLGKD